MANIYPGRIELSDSSINYGIFPDEKHAIEITGLLDGVIVEVKKR